LPTARTLVMPRCAVCGLHVHACVCALMTPLPVRTRVIVLVHCRELYRPSNTGRLLPLALAGCEIHQRGLPEGSAPLGPLTDPAVLFPIEGAEVLSAERAPATLVVSDGNWRQAKRIARREPALATARRVVLPVGPPSEYQLRSHPDPSRVSTFEAVARALGILEGPEVEAAMMPLFHAAVERVLRSRGR
jgi:DTW domain-containing protein